MKIAALTRKNEKYFRIFRIRKKKLKESIIRINKKIIKARRILLIDLKAIIEKGCNLIAEKRKNCSKGIRN